MDPVSHVQIVPPLHAPVAQRIEQGPSKPLVAGSTPAGRAKEEVKVEYYDNRMLCTVLEEMRACYKTRNFAGLLGLIEEAQSMGNRMESALEDKRWIKNVRNRIKKLQKLRDKLQAEVDSLNEKLGKEDEVPNGLRTLHDLYLDDDV